MEIPSGHPSSPTQISTNSKQTKTPQSESSQAAPQTQISNIYTQKHICSHSVPPQAPCITTQTKSSTTSYTSSSLTHKAKPKSQTNETNNFRNTSITTNLDANPTNTTETTVQRNIKE